MEISGAIRRERRGRGDPAALIGSVRRASDIRREKEGKRGTVTLGGEERGDTNMKKGKGEH